jgi:hypothetical protein
LFVQVGNDHLEENLGSFVGIGKDAPGAAMAAEEHFLQSLDWARRQGALSWELRTSASLARLQHDHGRGVEARSLLQSVYDRFTEGFDTPDLKEAKAILEDVASEEFSMGSGRERTALGGSVTRLISRN